MNERMKCVPLDCVNMSNDVMNWIEENRERSMLLENSKDGTESSLSKTSDETGLGYQNDSKIDDTSSSKSSEDEKRLQKQKKDLLHRDIEKRRRDRINNSLSELRELIPSAKTKLKCDGSTRSGRLQKAKLLELAVDYLRSMKGDSQTDNKLPTITRALETVQPKEEVPPKDPLVVESAKQIYVTGYKEGFHHAISQISKSATTDKGKELISPIDLKLINVPAMFLISEQERRSESICDSDSGRGSRSSVDGIHIPTTVVSMENGTLSFNTKSSHAASPSFEYPPKLTKMPSENGTSGNLNFNGQTSKNQTDPLNNAKSLDAKIFSERSPILISSYVLNETENRYYPTILPLDVLLKASGEKVRADERNIPSNMPHIYGEDTFNNPNSVLKRHHSQDTYNSISPNPPPTKSQVLDERSYNRETEMQHRYEWSRSLSYLRRSHEDY